MFYLCPGMVVAVRVGHGQNVPVGHVQEGLVGGEFGGQLVDGVERHRRTEPFGGVDGGVDEDADFIGRATVGQLEHRLRPALVAKADGFVRGDCRKFQNYFCDVVENLEPNTF